MCVAVPGTIVWIGEPRPGTVPGRMRCGGVELDVDLILTPDARVGDMAVAHAGYVVRSAPSSSNPVSVRRAANRRDNSDPIASAHASTSPQLRKSP